MNGAMSRVLITGITGQDGSYLTESHLASGDEVHGMVRQSSLLRRSRLDSVPALGAAREEGRLRLHYADLQDTSSLVALVRKVKPDVVYHLAGQSHVAISFDMPEYTAEVTGLGTLRLLEAVRQVTPECRFFFAATSEIFGEPLEAPQSETTPMAPVNPYAAAKVYALSLVRIYRQAYGLHASVGILFNHESPRRGENYVTRKIAGAAARISRGLQKELHLGTLDPRRDWSYAVDVVEGIRRIVAAEGGGDYVLASGVSHSVRDFCKAAFSRAGLDWKEHVILDPSFVRPLDISETRGNASKARRELGWAPRTSFEELVRIMVDAELEALDRPAGSA